MPYFAITGRVLFDDEDTTHTYQASNEDEACSAFKEEMLEGIADGPTPDDEVVINCILKSETPIEIVWHIYS